MDTTAITGESIPIEVAPGDAILAGSVNGTGTSPCCARPIARSSRASATENGNANAAASPTWPSTTAPIAAIVINSPTPKRPRPVAAN
ncbi:hypothetical protein SB749_12295 [Brevibacterium sp. SIMBA_078]|nr:hypothetical protein [Brevibacterium limosum]